MTLAMTPETISLNSWNIFCMVRLPLWAMPSPAMNENTRALITSTMAGILISKKGLSSSALSTATWAELAIMCGKSAEPVP